MKTNQEIFDIVAKHLLTQAAKSLSVQCTGTVYEHRACRYRGDEGRKCAVGVLIPDELYKAELEGWSVTNTYVMASMPEVEIESLDLVSKLQKLHDLADVYEWPVYLRELAAREGLSFNAEAYGLPQS